MKMKPPNVYTTELEKQLRNAIREMYTLQHVPKFITSVADIPYTVNGKKCEINVKQIVSCQKIVVSGTVVNPESLKLYRQSQSLPTDKAGSRQSKSKL